MVQPDFFVNFDFEDEIAVDQSSTQVGHPQHNFSGVRGTKRVAQKQVRLQNLELDCP